MSEQVVFTRALAELVWLLVYRSGATDEQKRALRATLLEARDEGYAVSLAELSRATACAAQLTPAPIELPWLHELSARMAGHAVGLLEVARGATAADVLGVARALALAPVQGDEGAAFDARVVALQLTTVNVRLGRAGFVRRATPMAMPRIAPAGPARTPGRGFATINGTPAMHREALSREPGIGAPTPASGMTRMAFHDATIGATVSANAGATVESSDDESSVQDRMIEAAFTRAKDPVGLDAVLHRLDGTLDGQSASAVLDVLTRASEDFARDGLWVDLADVMRRMIKREATATDAGVRRAFLIHLRRLFKPGVLRGLAQLMARRRDLRPSIAAIFVRAGEEGADTLLELLVASNKASERRAYRTVLASCPDAAEPLVHLLQDPRWYVVRNAAELLGEMAVQEADTKLIAVLNHGDARVRRSAAAALARLGTGRGIHALQPLLSDANAAVRLQAVHGIASARLPRSAPALVEALERESDPEIQHALLGALGAHPTDASVQRLSQAAQPGSLLSRKATPFRLAAISALAEAGTPAAFASLRAMQRDRDDDVRAAVERVLSAGAQGVGAGR